MSPAEWINVVLLGLSAASVYITANLPQDGIWGYSKGIMAGLAAGGVLLTSFIAEGPVTSGQWYQVGAAILGVIGTTLVPNPEEPPVIESGRHREAPA
jgi:hypothetical protein